MANRPILEKLKEVIIQKQTLNQNKSGTTITFLMSELDVDDKKIKELLNELHAQKLIIIRQGINGKLIFLRRQLSR